MKNKAVVISVIAVSFLIFIALILSAVNKKPPFKKEIALKGKIAIVIDDWGYHLNNLETVGRIKQRLTCAVLPNLINTEAAARKLHNSGFEIILHLPMEPKERYRLENNTVTLGMDARQIGGILKKGLASVRFAKGVSNHMGSRVTEDNIMSALILAEVKKNKLYFLDSFVTARSGCPALAKKMKVKFAKRDVFLDNLDDPEYIKGQLLKLKSLANKKGKAIGIGHDRANTLRVLKEFLPRIEKEGYKFVFVSEVAE